MATRSKPTAPNPPLEIASGVFFLEVGRGFMGSNVYFVRSGSSWVLVDAASARCALAIRAGATRVFGADSTPTAILLTHCHPDHDGSARELAASWGCPVYAHPDELPIACGDMAAIEGSANPLDRWFILPSLRLLGRKRMQAFVARSSLQGVIRPLDLHDSVPGLSDWVLIRTPGHTPGHVAFFRPRDKVLITGDALVTRDLNSLPGALSARQQVAGPPWYTTWDWKLAKRSAVSLAGLRPLVVAGGHGRPMSGPEAATSARSLLSRWI
jgi:glyoxylase-like metal-dependent hydrolase (beta-lactamase superfamily II)